MRIFQKIKKQKTPVLLLLCVMMVCIALWDRVSLRAQDFAYDNSGNIVWETKATGNQKAGYHYHTIGWTFTIKQKLGGSEYEKKVTVYLGNAYSSSKTYEKSGSISVTKTGTYSSKYSIPVSKLSALTKLSLERGTVKITVDAVIEFYQRSAKGKYTSKHVSTTKSDANKYCKKYGFKSNFDGSYTGYFGQTVTQKYFCLTVNKGSGIDKITINNSTLTPGKKMWFEKGTKIRLKAAAVTGYYVAGWNGDKQQSGETLSFKMPGEGLEISALAEAMVYPVALDGNGGTVGRPKGIKSDVVLEKYNTAWGYYPSSGAAKYWKGKNPATGFQAVRAGYAFQGFYTKKTGGTKIIDSSGKILCTYTTFSKEQVLYAQWKANSNTKYTVKHWQQNIGGMGYTLKDTETLTGQTDSTVVPKVKTYEGFYSPVETSAVIKGDGSAVVNYYYDRKMYEVALKCGDGVEKAFVSGGNHTGEYKMLRCWYDEKVTLRAENMTGYQGTQWSGTFYVKGETYTFSMPAYDVVEAVTAEPIQYKIIFDGNGADSGFMLPMALSYGIGKCLYSNRFGKDGYEFTGWSRNEDGEAEFSDGEEVKNLTTQNEDIIYLYAVWRECKDDDPVITAKDRAFTLTQAQTGQITEEELFRTASARDEEDGMIEPGIREDNSFVITDYDPSRFTSLCHDASVHVTYRASDCAGNVAECTVCVYVTDEKGNTDPDGRKGFRFISKKYLDETPENGGLSKNSIWRGGDYYELLVKLLKNKK